MNMGSFDSEVTAFLGSVEWRICSVWVSGLFCCTSVHTNWWRLWTDCIMLSSFSLVRLFSFVNSWFCSARAITTCIVWASDIFFMFCSTVSFWGWGLD